MADRGYDAKRIRRYLRERGIRAMIPERRPGKGRRRRRRGRPPVFEEKLYAKRNVIERLIGWMKECRRLATRFDKLARCYLAMVKLACIRRCFRKLDFSDRAYFIAVCEQGPKAFGNTFTYTLLHERDFNRARQPS